MSIEKRTPEEEAMGLNQVEDPEVARKAALIEKPHRDLAAMPYKERHKRYSSSASSDEEEQGWIVKDGKEKAERFLRQNDKLPKTEEERKQKVEELLIVAKKLAEEMLDKMAKSGFRPSKEFKHYLDLKDVTAEDIISGKNNAAERLRESSNLMDIAVEEKYRVSQNMFEHLAEGLVALTKEIQLLQKGELMDKEHYPSLVEDNLKHVEEVYLKTTRTGPKSIGYFPPNS